MGVLLTIAVLAVLGAGLVAAGVAMLFGLGWAIVWLGVASLAAALVIARGSA